MKGAEAGGGATPGGGSTEMKAEEEEKGKACPLLSMGLTSGIGKKRLLSCMGSECAWWNREGGCCAMVVTSRR